MDAKDIQKILDRLGRATELAKSRAAAAAKKADEVADELSKGSSEDAAEAANDAAGMFRELADHVTGLLADEASQRVAKARDIASRLSDMERELASEIPNSEPGGQAGNEPGKNSKQPGNSGETGSPSNEALAKRSERMTGSGKSLEDILNALAKSDDPAEREAMDRVNEAIKEANVRGTVARLENVPPLIRGGQWLDAKLETKEIANDLEMTAQKLDGVVRRIVSPRLEELMRMERQLADLERGLKELKTQSAIGMWHQEAQEQMDQVQKAGVSTELSDQLLDDMRNAGWSPNEVVATWNWQIGSDGHYFAPGVYFQDLHRINEELQGRIQELILGEMRNADDDATPPQFEHLVERYYRVLSATGRADARKASAPRP